MEIEAGKGQGFRSANWWPGRLMALVMLGLSLLGLGAVCVIEMYYTPRFEKIFQEFDATLPSSTVAAVEVSHVLKRYGVFIIPGIALVYAGLVWVSWKCHWGYGVGAGAAMALLALVSLVAMWLSLFMPLASIVHTARAGGGGGGP